MEDKCMFSERMKYLLHETKTSKAKLARSIGLPTTICRYADGKRSPQISILVKMANYFNVSTDYLLGLEQLKKQPNCVNLASELRGEAADHAHRFENTKKEKQMKFFHAACIKDTGNTFKNEFECCLINIDAVKKISEDFRGNAVLHFVDSTTAVTNTPYSILVKEIV